MRSGIQVRPNRLEPNPNQKIGSISPWRRHSSCRLFYVSVVPEAKEQNAKIPDQFVIIVRDKFVL